MMYTYFNQVTWTAHIAVVAQASIFGDNINKRFYLEAALLYCFRLLNLTR